MIEKGINLIRSLETSRECIGEIFNLEKESLYLKKQETTLSIISSDFNSKQEQEIKKFLSKISENLNTFYNSMDN